MWWLTITRYSQQHQAHFTVVDRKVGSVCEAMDIVANIDNQEEFSVRLYNGNPEEKVVQVVGF